MSKSDMITLPPGIGRYLALNKPDTKFDDLGMYKSDVILPRDEAEPYMKRFLAAWKEHTGKAAKATDNPMFKEEVDAETGEPTGNIIFQIRVKNKLSKKTGKPWDRRPMLIDAKKTPMNPDIPVWGGSKIRVQAEVYKWEFGGKKGVSLQPVVVQVIDLVSGSGPDLSDFDEEDGYEDDGVSTVDTSDFNDESGNSSGGADY